jgi:hypothetical protein
MIGILGLLFHLLVFQGAFGILAPEVSSTLSNIVSDGLLVVSALCILTGVWFQFANDKEITGNSDE